MKQEVMQCCDAVVGGGGAVKELVGVLRFLDIHSILFSQQLKAVLTFRAF
jgi:hypothetical protein